MTSAALRRRALTHKLALLERETAAWRAESADAKSRFALHASQIAAVGEDLKAMHGLIAAEIEGLPAEPAHEALARQERRILAALQIWDSYRAKWALRVEPGLARTLAAIDDLAWHAYRPAVERALAAGALAPARARMPPLVYPNTRWSPFARPRELGYELDETQGSWRLIEDFEPVLRCMPVPLIGIPWTQAAHLADAVFVGHEVGHLVEEDLDLGDALAAAVVTGLPAAAQARAPAWSEAWRSEMFADLWGLLCCGPAFALTLTDLLLGAGAALDAPQPDAQGRHGAYPPRALRVGLLAELLTRRGFDAAATELRAQAAALPATMPDHASDVGAVAQALDSAALATFAKARGKPGEAPSTVLNFTPAMHKQAEADAERALLSTPQPLQASDLRVVFAALALAFRRSPQVFVERQVQQQFESRLEDLRTKGVRAAPGLPRAAADPGARGERAAAAVFAWADGPHSG